MGDAVLRIANHTIMIWTVYLISSLPRQHFYATVLQCLVYMRWQ